MYSLMLINRTSTERLLERHPSDDFVMVLIASIYFLSMGSQVGIDEAQQGLIHLEAYTHSSFVALQV